MRDRPVASPPASRRPSPASRRVARSPPPPPHRSIAPCDSTTVALIDETPQATTVVHVSNPNRRRSRRSLFVRVPPGTRAGDIVQTTAPDGRVVSAHVPLRVGPGDTVRIDY